MTALAHPGIAEWAAMSATEQDLVRAQTLARKLRLGGVTVTGVQILMHRIALYVDDVAEAVLVLGWSQSLRIFGDVREPLAVVQSDPGPEHTSDRIIGPAPSPVTPGEDMEGLRSQAAELAREIARDEAASER
ncbi:hypothetical protein OEB99_16725 [Actinotalea sp. M2MS4P-6]|uniref:hypothetical protein n=1 Tax=Actinotalea sp. M2MS4P-6 TaxID=2983762 RepID=UPI0021E5044A|nr:hypothetical protein [Actinotalea sp. M2MS4P-6]MCV2395962.1 hypothetical protein [Actinotalea sp. M2MS4P-6]